MKKNQLNRFMVVLFAMLTVSLTSVWAISSPYVGTPSGSVSAKGGEVTLNGVTWTYGSANYLAISNSMFQIGSKNNPQTEGWTISTPISSFGTGVTITKVKISAKTGDTGTFDISVGGSSKLNGSLATSVTDYETAALGVTSGNIDITITGEVKAAYLGDITVTFTKSSTDPELSVDPESIDFGKVEVGTASVAGQEVTVTMENIDEVLIGFSTNSPFQVDKESLTGSGVVTITPTAATMATVGEYSDTLTITDAEELTKKVPVSIKVTDPAVIEKGFKHVTNASVLKAGDELILGAAITSGETTSYFAAGAFGENKFFSAKEASVSDGEIAASEAIIIKLGGAAGAWTFTTSEGLVGTKAAKALVLDDAEATTTWTISIEDGNAIITSTGEGLGSIQYNSGNPRFLNYTSAQKPIQLYRRAKGSSVPTPVTSVSFEEKTAEVKVGKTLKLKYAIAPDTATDQRVSFLSLNENALTVAKDGTITGVAVNAQVGVVITALDSLNKGEKLTDTCYVEVKAADPKPVLQEINTIANIIACYDEGVVKDNDEVNVTGYISNMFLKPDNFAKYGSVTIWLCSSSEGVGTDKEFELYNCYGQDGDTLVSFLPEATGSSNVDVTKVTGRAGISYATGDSVVAFGKIKKYGTTYELLGGCYMVSGGTPTRINEVADKKQARKAMINGQMVIIRDGKMFNALGAEL